MGYSLSFSPEFFYAPDETEREPAVNADGNPISLYGAIMSMPKRDFKRACKLAGIDPSGSEAAAKLVGYAKETVDWCRNISTPVEVAVTAGDWPITVLVYDGPEVHPKD